MSPKLRKILFFCTIFLSCFCINAIKIGQITFEQSGVIKVPESLIKYNLVSKPGNTFREDTLNDDIKRLYNTGYFSDVETSTQTNKDGDIDIVFKLKNTERIKDIVVEGSKKFDKNEILELILLHKSEPLDEKKYRKSIENIRDFYVKKGYSDVEIYPSTEDTKDGEVIVKIKIDENLRVKIDTTQFIGNTVFSSWTLKDTVQSRHSYLNWLLDWGLYDADVARQDEIRLRDLYWTKGYLDFSVKTEIQQEKENPDYINVIFHITEGKSYTISKVSLQGNKAFTKRELMKLVELKHGKIYDLSKEQKTINSIEKKYAKLGYCDFYCKAKLDPDYQTHKVAVIFNINEGHPFTVRNINISGNQIAKDYVLRRELPIDPGDPIDKTRIEAGKSRLMGMNYFKKVDVYTTNTNVPGEKNVNYEVEEKGTAHASIGAGYSSDDSLVGRLALSESDFDITDPSTYFRGGGEHVSLFGQIGLERNDAALTFSEPWLFGVPLRLDTSGFFHAREYDYWDEQHAGFNIGLTKPFGEFNSVGLSYILDFVRISKMSDRYSQKTKDQNEGNSRKGAVDLLLQRDTRDSLFNPTSGYLLSALSEIVAQGLCGSTNYYKIELEASDYYSFIQELFVLHLGVRGGAMGGIGDPTAVPLYDKYFLGGQHSIRGFAFRKVSPLNGSKAPMGGQSMLVGTAEITHPIYKWIRGAAFVDVGNAWSNPFQYSLDMNVGVGYGLRILIPQLTNVPIALDFAVPVYSSNRKFNQGVQFYFDVGIDW